MKPQSCYEFSYYFASVNRVTFVSPYNNYFSDQQCQYIAMARAFCNIKNYVKLHIWNYAEANIMDYFLVVQHAVSKNRRAIVLLWFKWKGGIWSNKKEHRQQTDCLLFLFWPPWSARVYKIVGQSFSEQLTLRGLEQVLDLLDEPLDLLAGPVQLLFVVVQVHAEPRTVSETIRELQRRQHDTHFDRWRHGRRLNTDFAHCWHFFLRRTSAENRKFAATNERRAHTPLERRPTGDWRVPNAAAPPSRASDFKSAPRPLFENGRFSYYYSQNSYDLFRIWQHLREKFK